MAGARLGVLLSFLLFFIAGIPLWWKTTEVYRAPMPDVASWEVPQVHFPTQVTKPSEVIRTLKTIAMRQVGPQSYIPKFEFSVSENRYLEKYNEADNGNGKESDYDDTLWNNFGSYESTGRVYFYVVHSPTASSDVCAFYCVVPELSQGDFYFNKWGGALIKTSASLHEGAGMPLGVVTSISNVVVKLWFGAIDAAQQRIAIPVAAEHRITFTLMSGGPLPEGTNPDRFAKAVSRYFDDFARNFSAAAKLSITTQVQQMVAPLKAPQYDTKSRTFFYTRENLPYFLRPADMISDATATNQSGLHFIMYLPASSISPLRIKDSPTNAYLIPRTGGVIINNVFEDSDTSSFGISSKDLTTAMRTFMAQLRELLGVPIIRISGAKTIPAASGLAYWERDLVFKYRIAEYLRSSVASLSSVHRLVSTITNMGVLDDVKERVDRILAKIDETKRALRDSAYLTALKASRTAFVESERLFFDPNMLPQLYFPDEHKYAIYVPMFLPILVPILTGIFGEFRERRERGKKAAVPPTKKND